MLFIMQENSPPANKEELVQIGWSKQFKKTDLPFSILFLRDISENFLQKLGLAGGRLSIWLDSDKGISQLNYTRHGKLQPTDVLAWRYWEVSPETCAEAGGLLGEVAISLEASQRQALCYGWDWQAELLRLLAHGCAHVAGYDHQTPSETDKMQAQEALLLQLAGLKLDVSFKA